MLRPRCASLQDVWQNSRKGVHDAPNCRFHQPPRCTFDASETATHVPELGKQFDLEHPPGRVLAREERSDCSDLDRASHILDIKFCNRPADARG